MVKKCAFGFALVAMCVACSGESRLPGITGGGGSLGSGGAGPGTTSSTTTTTTTGTGGAPSSSAADFAGKLGKKNFMIGLGPRESMYPKTGQLDVRYIYLVGNKDAINAWPKWNQPDGEYATIVAKDALQHGAVPMFTIYDLAALGDGNYGAIRDATYMPRVWAEMQLLADKIKAFGGRALVHVEPDFMGYAQQHTPGGDPSTFMAQVKVAPACGDLPDDLTGYGACLLRIFHTASPNALVGFHASKWAAYGPDGKEDGAAVGRFISKVTAGKADFIVTDLLDRDAGCFELQVNDPMYNCVRGGTTGWYWDETNMTSPNFHDFLAWAKALHDGAGIPIVFWQIPMGEPSPTPGGTPGHYRDNRVHYIFSHVREFIDVGGAGAFFGPGASGQTSVGTDNGQFEKALNAYNQAPEAL
jgi:hypothetical protein